MYREPRLTSVCTRLQHRVASTDGGHGAFVFVLECVGIQPSMQPGDLPGGKLPHLESRLRELRQRVVHDDAAIADGEDSLLSDDSGVFVDLDSPRPADR